MDTEQIRTALMQAETDAALCHQNDAPTAARVYERKAARLRTMLAAVSP